MKYLILPFNIHIQLGSLMILLLLLLLSDITALDLRAQYTHL